MPQTSIIIPVYNGEQYLAQTIESVRAQTVTDWELVVVDDGSADRSAAIAQGYAARDGRIRMVQQANAGVAAARNRGLREISSSSEYVTLLDQDDLWAPNALEALLKELAAAPDAVAAHGLMRSIDAHGRPCPPDRVDGLAQRRRAIVGGRPSAWPAPQPTIFAVLVYMNPIVTPGQVLMRRRALEEAGPFDAAAAPADDWDMWLRLSSRGDIQYVDTVVLSWRRHETNASRQRSAMHDGETYMYGKLLGSRELSEEQRRLARAGYRWFRRTNGGLFWGWARQNAARGQWISAAKQARHAVIELAQSYAGASPG